MEIKTEADDVDEGVSPNELKSLSMVLSNTSATRWMSPKIQKKLRHMRSFNKSA